MYRMMSLLAAASAFGQDSVSVASEMPLPALQQTQTDTCKALVQRAREVERLLRTVSDRKSADAVAEQVSLHLGEMKKGFQHLEKQAPANDDEARAVALEMRSLAHVMQGIMPVLQVLREVNAYGSEALINVFYLYKLLPPATAPQQPTPADVWFQA